MTPEARKDGLLVQVVGDETIIYDQQRDHAHRLNRTAALVWQACDGQRTVADLTRTLQQEIGSAADEDLVLLALDRLEKGHLLQSPLAASQKSSQLTRRDAVRRMAIAGGMTLMIPLVQSMVAPTPAMAASACLPVGSPAATGAQCCSGLARYGQCIHG